MADSSKTEKATPKRREKAREQGQVARSRELPGVLALAGVLGALWLMSFGAITHWTSFYRNVLDAAATGAIESNGPVLFWSAVEVLRWIVPVLATAAALSLAAGVAQGGVSLSPAAMSLKFERFNPASKVGQIFSLAGLSGLMKSMLPFAAIAWLGASVIREHWVTMVHASYFNLSLFASLVGGMLFEVTWQAGLVLLAWAGVDYLLTWQKMEGDLKMTKEEVRQEHKQLDGNPVIKQRIRRLQRQMRRRQSLKAAATATVVITNPTHYAVALRYTPEMVAPTVVAKGQNLLAQEIKQLAIENGIMLMENKPLAQALYKSVEVGEAIPSMLYQAVADILVVVFRAQAELRAQEAARRGRNAAGEVIRP
ncbi:MAG TPA: EscU/YscU/HrcU family type III secretion system export apparatus switch protein [Acidobacteriaceae bacterium]